MSGRTSFFLDGCRPTSMGCFSFPRPTCNVMLDSSLTRRDDLRWRIPLDFDFFKACWVRFQQTPRYATVSKRLKLIIDIRYQCGILVCLVQHDPPSARHSLCDRSPICRKVYGIISFTDPRPLTLLESYGFKNDPGEARSLCCKSFTCHTSETPEGLPFVLVASLSAFLQHF